MAEMAGRLLEKILLALRAPRQQPAAVPPLDAAAIAIFAGTSTGPSVDAIFPFVSGCCREVLQRCERNCQMQRVRSLLRGAPSHIGRGIARFVAIAAASLPDVGA
jgi:hypothetical protein